VARQIKTLSKVPSLTGPEFISKKWAVFGLRSGILAVPFHFSGIKECPKQADIPSKDYFGYITHRCHKRELEVVPERPLW
jgi:hypothetical protein